MEFEPCFHIRVLELKNGNRFASSRLPTRKIFKNNSDEILHQTAKIEFHGYCSSSKTNVFDRSIVENRKVSTNNGGQVKQSKARRENIYDAKSALFYWRNDERIEESDLCLDARVSVK